MFNIQLHFIYECFPASYFVFALIVCVCVCVCVCVLSPLDANMDPDIDVANTIKTTASPTVLK